MRLEWTPNSRTQVRRIRAYIARDAEEAADAFIDKLFTAAERLESFPYLGGVVEKWNREDLREILVGNYRLIYLVTAEEVTVLTVMHAARRLPDQPEF